MTVDNIENWNLRWSKWSPPKFFPFSFNGFFSELIVTDIEQLGATKNSMLIWHGSIYYLHAYHRDFYPFKKTSLTQGQKFRRALHFLHEWSQSTFSNLIYEQFTGLESMTRSDSEISGDFFPPYFLQLYL